ncbi:MAG: alpha/beta hydrolase [Kineosporiaceae bacterium]|nr:alpha/beta hydrolase [Kineosporiaceae bacterium]
MLLANRALARRTERIAGALIDNALMRRLVFATGSSNPAALHPGVARGMVHALAHSTAYEVMLDATSRRRFERKAQVHVPTVVVFGDRDLILPAPNQRPELAPAHAEWQRWERCGHAPMWDHPQRTVELIQHTVAAAPRRPNDPVTQATTEPGEG